MNKQYMKAKQKGVSNIDLLRMKEIARKEADAMMERASRKAFFAMLTIPLNVLVHNYWSKTAKKKAPQFIDDVLSLYDSYEKGYVSDEELIKLLKDYADYEIEYEK